MKFDAAYARQSLLNETVGRGAARPGAQRGPAVVVVPYPLGGGLPLQLGKYHNDVEHRSNITSPAEHFDGVHGVLLVGKRNASDRKYTSLKDHSASVMNSQGIVPADLWLRCKSVNQAVCLSVQFLQLPGINIVLFYLQGFRRAFIQHFCDFRCDDLFQL